jgi:curved DNA-binding protein CbpA
MSLNPRLLETLLNLYKSGQSGVLRAQRSLAKKQLVVKKGLLVFAESNLPEEHLARILISMGFLPRAKLNEIASLMKTGKTSEEAVFAGANSDEHALEKGRLEQATVILASLLGWDNFDLHFYPGEDLIRHQTNLGLTLPEILVISARRAVSGNLVPIPPKLLQGTVSIAEAFSQKGLDFPLNSIESYAYSLLHGKMDTAVVLPLIPAGEATPEEVLLRLYVLGLIKLESPLVAQSVKTHAATVASSIAPLLEDMALRFETASLYEILSIQTDASPEEIQAAYHDLAKQFHPDRFQSEEFTTNLRNNAERVFTYMNAAYTTLRDPVSRACYDETRLTKESKVEAALKARAATGSEEEKMTEVLFREGRTSLARGDFEKAVEQLKSCVWMHPEKANYNYYLGMAESEIPKLRKSAEQHLLKAAELESTSANSHLELAKLYIKVMLPRKAEMQLQEILRWDPENREAHKLLADLEKLDTARAGISRRIKHPFSR